MATSVEPSTTILNAVLTFPSVCCMRPTDARSRTSCASLTVKEMLRAAAPGSATHEVDVPLSVSDVSMAASVTSFAAG